jgi:hypothetical protein
VGFVIFAESIVAELELRMESRKGEALSTLTKYWICLLLMDPLEIVRTCYNWQIHNRKPEVWANILEDG